MNSRVQLSVLLPLIFCATALAQLDPPPGPDQVGLTLTSTVTGSGKGSLKDNNTTYKDIRATSMAWGLQQHISIGKRDRMTVGLDYSLVDINLPQNNQPPLPDRLQSLGASVRYFHAFSRQWMMSTSVGAGSNVTNTGLLSDGWAERVSVVGIYNRSAEFTYIFGAAYNSNVNDLRIVPVLGLNWRPTEQWSVAFGFPRTGVTYKVNPKLALSMDLTGAGGGYFVKNDPRPGIAPQSLADSRLQYLEVRLGFEAAWKINETFRLTGSVGQVLFRQLKYIDRDYKLKSDGTVPFITLGARISL
jgi:hypothetical protein